MKHDTLIFLGQLFRGTRGHRVTVCLIVVLAALLRLWGITFGSPLLVHPDEPEVLNPAYLIWKNRTLDPDIYRRPNHISIYLNALSQQMFSLIRFQAPITATYHTHRLAFYFFSRTLVALFGVMTVLLAYLAGRLFSANLGLIFALLFAVFPAYVEHSHYVSPDITVTCFLVAVIYFSLLYRDMRTTPYLVLMSLLTGIATAEKYPGLLGMLLVSWVIIEANRHSISRMLRDLVRSWVVFFLTIVLCAPFLIIRFETTVSSIFREARMTHLGADGLGYWGNMAFYFLDFVENTGLLTVFFLVWGSVMVLRKEKTRAVPLFLGAVLLLVLSKIPLHWTRWALPMMTSGLFLSGYGIYHCGSLSHTRLWTSRTRTKKFLHIMVMAVLCVPIVGMLLTSVFVSRNLSLPDTRSEALAFCQSENITPHNSVYEWYTPFAPGASGKGTRDFFGHVIGALDNRDISIRYVILSSRMFERYYAEPERYADKISVYERVKREGIEIKAFLSDDRPGTNATKTLKFKPSLRWFPTLRTLEAYFRVGRDERRTPLQGPEIFIYRISRNQSAHWSGGRYDHTDRGQPLAPHLDQEAD